MLQSSSLKIVLIAILFNAAIHTAQAPSTSERYQRAKNALTAFNQALRELNVARVDSALQEIKDARTHFSFWERWFGGSISEVESVILEALNDDRWLLDSYYHTRALHPDYFKRHTDAAINQRFDEADRTIPRHIKRSLGYGHYVDAADALSEISAASKECNPTRIERALASLTQARAQFPALERLGVWTPRAMKDREEWSRHYLFLSAATACHRYSELVQGCTETSRCKAALALLQQEYDIEQCAITESASKYTEKLRSNPAMLEALYQRGALLHSENLLEHARRAQQKDIMDLILRHRTLREDT